MVSANDSYVRKSTFGLLRTLSKVFAPSSVRLRNCPIRATENRETFRFDWLFDSLSAAFSE
jgi:hypothetical protein